MIRALLAIIFVAASLSARAEGGAATVLDCARQASERGGVPDVVMAVIIGTEGGWPGAEIRNANGSHDLGVAQINTIHLPTFAAFGITREQLRDDACVNLAAAAYLLRQHHKATQSWGKAITRYHSKTPEHAARYAGRALGVLRRIAPRALASAD